MRITLTPALAVGAVFGILAMTVNVPAQDITSQMPEVDMNMEMPELDMSSLGAEGSSSGMDMGNMSSAFGDQSLSSGDSSFPSSMTMNMASGEDLLANMKANSDMFLKDMMGESYTGINEALFDLGDMSQTLDMTSLNEQYAQMTAQFALQGFGESVDLEVPKLKNLASNSMEVFEQSFKGVDFSGKYQTFSIPEGFDANSWMASLNTERDAAIQSMENSDFFKNVRGNINIEDTFSKANKNLAKEWNYSDKGYGTSSFGDLLNDLGNATLGDGKTPFSAKNIYKDQIKDASELYGDLKKNNPDIQAPYNSMLKTIEERNKEDAKDDNGFFWGVENGSIPDYYTMSEQERIQKYGVL